MDPTSHASTGHPKKHPPSSSELLSSAKLVAEAAKASLHHETGKVDKGRVAGATADLLNAASHYGKLEEKGMGKYVDKAETYLHQYHSSHSSTTTTTTHSGHHSNTTTTTTQSSSHSGGGGGDGHSSGGSGGYGEYIKMAQGFMKNSDSSTTTTTTQSSSSHSSGGGDGSSGGSGGYGEYFKMAEGFLKKH